MAAGAFRLVEADLLSLSAEARRSLPAVKEAAERAVFELRQRGGADALGALAPADLAAVRAAVLAPLLVAANHTDAPKRVLTIALGALQRLITADCVTPADMPSIARVLEIQVRARPRAEAAARARAHPLSLHAFRARARARA